MLKLLKYCTGTIVLFLLLLASCTIGPNSGIETGNPKIMASVHSALGIFDSNERWNPAEYLVRGDAQLDPEIVYSRPTVFLAKTTVSNDSASLKPVQIVQRVDTVIIVDTVYVKDTVTQTRMISDTLFYDGIDGYKVITKNQLTDTVFVIDTIEVRDTITIVHYDTLNTFDSSKGSNDNRTVTVPSSQVSWGVSSDVDSTMLNEIALKLAYENTSAVSPVEWKYKSVTDTAITFLNRQGEQDGMIISEQYRDGDGDSILGLYYTKKKSLIDLYATYSISDSTTVLQVLFDGGIDDLFSSTGNNRIYSLKRTRLLHDQMVENVVYSKKSISVNGDDTIILSCNVNNVDSIQSSVTEYVCISGGDKYDHSQNRVLAIHSEFDYKGSGMESVKTSIIPDMPLQKNQKPSTARLSVTYDFGKGLLGILDGVLDYQTHRFSGTYAEGGVEYTILYDDITGTFVKEGL